VEVGVGYISILFIYLCHKFTYGMGHFKTFIAYSRADQTEKDFFVKHLSPLEKSGLITIWTDANIKPGELWEKEIFTQLSKAEVIIFLISIDFNTSNFIQDTEFKKAKERFENKEVLIIPILIRDCMWEEFELVRDLQILPGDGKSIQDYTSKDSAYTNITRSIKQLLQDYKRERVDLIVDEIPHYQTIQEVWSAIEVHPNIDQLKWFIKKYESTDHHCVELAKTTLNKINTGSYLEQSESLSLKPALLLLDKYKLITRISVSDCAEVWSAEDVLSETEVAIKFFLDQDSKGIQLFKKEYKILRQLNHPNLTKYEVFSIFERKPLWVMPFYINGSVATQAGKIGENSIARLIENISSVLIYLHERQEPIIHGNITIENILVEEDGNYVLTNLSKNIELSSHLEKVITLATRTMRTERSNTSHPNAYKAPELIDFKNKQGLLSSEKSDIWALGVVLFYLINKVLPYGDLGGLLMRINQQKGQNAFELEFNSSFSVRLKDIVFQCLSINPLNRPTPKKLNEWAKYYLRNKAWPAR
jgi:Protein kinase domain/TIR domain